MKASLVNARTRTKQGQATSEYVLILCVVVLGLVLVTFGIKGRLLMDLGENMSQRLMTVTTIIKLPL